MTYILSSVLVTICPLLLAALGGLFSNIGGTLNIALEGLMLLGSFSGYLFCWYTGSLLIGLLCASALTAAAAALLALIVFRLKAQPFIAGLALNLLFGGLCPILSGRLFGTEGVLSLSGIPSPSGALFAVLTAVMTATTLVILFMTPFGLRLRACGMNRDAVLCAGLSPERLQIRSWAVCGALCALGGSAVSLQLGSYVPGATSGKGWIALVIVFLGGNRPLGLAGAAAVFALAEALGNHLQGLWNIPAEYILALPYILTLTVLVVFSAVGRHRRSFKSA